MDIGEEILDKAGIEKHYIRYASFNKGEFKINTPAFSLGFNIIYPVGAVFIEESLKKFKRSWLKYVVAHETAHIILNHYPINIILAEGLSMLPLELRLALNLYSFMRAMDVIKVDSPLEGITAEKELDADEWAVKNIGFKKPAIEFLQWLKDKGIKISHFSPYTGLPALSIDERIRRIRKVRVR